MENEMINILARIKDLYDEIVMMTETLNIDGNTESWNEVLDKRSIILAEIDEKRNCLSKIDRLWLETCSKDEALNKILKAIQTQELTLFALDSMVREKMQARQEALQELIRYQAIKNRLINSYSAGSLAAVR